MTVRAARADDDDALLAIDRATFSPLTTPAPEPNPGPFFTDRTLPENVLVAERDGTPVGWAKIDHPTPLPASAHVWHVMGFAVDPDAQGKGVGRALLEAVIDEVRRRGGRKLTLRVFGPNERARRLYERAGFELEGILRDEFLTAEGYVDDYVMALDLTR